MTILVGDSIKIETDVGSSLVVRTKRVATTGKNVGETSWDADGYFGGLESALRYCLKLKMAASKSVHADLESAVEEIRDLWREIGLSVPEGTTMAATRL